MLVITLKKGERVKIGDDVYITYTRPANTSRAAIRLGFEAPKEKSIKRIGEKIDFKRRGPLDER